MILKKYKYFIFIFFIVIINSCIGDGHKKVIVQDSNGFFKEEFIVINDSIKDGVYLKYFSNGNLWDSCFYKNDTIQGKRKIFTDKGILEISENYKNGVLEGDYKVYYPNGKIKILQKFRNNIMVDTSYSYFKNGNLKEKVVFENGLENGPFEEYYENGNIHWKGTYLNGDNEQDTLLEYSEKGELIKKMICDRGICFTIWTKENGRIKPDTSLKKALLKD